MAKVIVHLDIMVVTLVAIYYSIILTPQNYLQHLDFIIITRKYIKSNGGCSSVGRATDCGSVGRQFKPGHSPHLFII